MSSKHWTSGYGLKGRTIYRLLTWRGWEPFTMARDSVVDWRGPHHSPYEPRSTRSAFLRTIVGLTR